MFRVEHGWGGQNRRGGCDLGGGLSIFVATNQGKEMGRKYIGPVELWQF